MVLDDKDIQRIITAAEEVFPTKAHIDDSRFDEAREDFSELQSAVDAYAKKQIPTTRKWRRLALKLIALSKI